MLRTKEDATQTTKSINFANTFFFFKPLYIILDTYGIIDCVWLNQMQCSDCPQNDTKRAEGTPRQHLNIFTTVSCFLVTESG